MSQSRVPLDPDLLLAAARMANLPLSREHVAQLVPLMEGTCRLLDALSQAKPGETAPATA